MSGTFESLLIDRNLADRYLLEGVLGRGGMSVVYRALDQRLGRPVAVKVIHHPEGSDDLRDHLRQRFGREASFVARIPPHPNVVQIYDYGTDPDLDLDFIVMELLQGQDLKGALSTSRFVEDEAVRILLQATAGIGAGHRAGFVHRDIKPGNIFLAGEEKTVRILDFGIAKALEGGSDEDLTVLGTMPHSPAYASPEQLTDAGVITPASDVYQLGLVGYEMLAGARAFLPEERERIRSGVDLPLPSRGHWDRISPPVRQVVSRALDPDPARRFPDALSFAEALSAARGDDQTLWAGESVPEWGGSAEDRTLLGEATIARNASASLPSPVVPAGVAAPRRAVPRLNVRSRPVQIGAAAVLLLMLWAAFKLVDPGVDPGGTATADPAIEKFQDLQSTASRRLEREGAWERP